MAKTPKGKPKTATKGQSGGVASKKKKKKAPLNKCKPDVEESEWELAAFTKKAVAFNKAERDMSAVLQETYGEQVPSIGQYETFCTAAQFVSNGTTSGSFTRIGRPAKK
ncbi:hypothetical protein SEMRO_2363_G324920.1 [Seminavis robusta]|uniref:Uncharacterized protein n=1 Tax=Seminavis robusta TaxID=568900 RepID=A0A9N8EZ24_9STRA|nr:hypothetical protein SEMRO_2363_G324920.1 [Seminavis robusta]|eukprot:Sro2363_g324920.1 n/a (109) ;mRNA; f:5454-5780